MVTGSGDQPQSWDNRRGATNHTVAASDSHRCPRVVPSARVAALHGIRRKSNTIPSSHASGSMQVGGAPQTKETPHTIESPQIRHAPWGRPWPWSLPHGDRCNPWGQLMESSMESPQATGPPRRSGSPKAAQLHGIAPRACGRCKPPTLARRCGMHRCRLSECKDCSIALGSGGRSMRRLALDRRPIVARRPIEGDQ